MASAAGKNLPSLKICIDNESAKGEISDDDLSLTEEPDITLAEEEPSEIVQKTDSDSEHEVQFNVFLEKREPKPNTNDVPATVQPSRRYKNKEGDFVTGIDFTKKEERDKREERAKRFGVPVIPEPEVDLDGLYKSLNIKPEDLERKDERGIRLEAIHFRGIAEMNTKDVFNYFKEFAAGGCEWIDDNSCNVVWMDKVTAARAMLKLSKSYDEVMGVRGRERPARQTERQTEETDMETDSKIAASSELGSTTEKDRSEDCEEKMEEDDDDNLDLTEEKKEDISGETAEQKKTKEVAVAKTTGAGAGSDMEEGEITDSDSNSNDGSADNSSGREGQGDGGQQKNIPWPPGRWRQGVPFPPKANQLFLRFATKADKKLPGAERRSRYYQKYGNPNYGGIRGLISNSMKRRMRNYKDPEEFDDSPRETPAVSALGNRTAVSYEGVDMFTDNITPLEAEEGMDLYPKKTSEDVRKFRPHSSDEEEEEEEEEEDSHPVIEKVVINKQPDGEASDSSEIDEAELERLLGRVDKKPTMKMYADEIEEKQKAKRQQQAIGALTVVAEDKKKMKVRDARQLITGIDTSKKMGSADMRSKLNQKNRSRSSPEPWESRSLSPVDMRSRIQRKRSPVIIRRLRRSRSRSPVDMRSRLTRSRGRRSRSRSPLMIRSRLNRSRSPLIVRPRGRPRRSRSPLIIRSRLNRSRSPADMRSRLNRRNRRSRIPASESDSESSSSDEEPASKIKLTVNQESSSSDSSSSSSSSGSSSSSSSSSDSSDSDSDSSSDHRSRRKDLRGRLDSRKKTAVKSKSKFPSMKIEVLD